MLPLHNFDQYSVGYYAFKHWKLDSLAHDKGINGEGVLVAVLDTGVLTNHVAFGKTCQIRRYL
jgi:subtilisin family serine protease